jgi:hypothetical protein
MWLLEPVILITSVQEVAFEKNAAVYPNPSNGDFTLSLSHFAAGEKVSITIFNLAGQALYSNSCAIGENGINNVKVKADHILSSGNYYVVAEGKSNFARAKLLINKQ